MYYTSKRYLFYNSYKEKMHSLIIYIIIYIYILDIPYIYYYISYTINHILYHFKTSRLNRFASLAPNAPSKPPEITVRRPLPDRKAWTRRCYVVTLGPWECHGIYHNLSIIFMKNGYFMGL